MRLLLEFVACDKAFGQKRLKASNAVHLPPPRLVAECLGLLITYFG